jgi:uncharacterized membrane protein
MTEAICSISHQKYDVALCHRLDTLAEPIRKLFQKDYPDLVDDSLISQDQIIIYRKKYLNQLILSEYGEVDVLEKKVVDAIAKNEILSENIETDLNEHISFGEKMADYIALFGGSWGFIIFFFVFIFLWILINVITTHNLTFDPYPFILLNLILSCLASIQAPIIMMSQNRQEHKDRSRNVNDYKVNLKAELEIQLLHEKLDHLMVNQNKKLLEIQQIQVDLFDDILRQVYMKKQNIS